MSGDYESISTVIDPEVTEETRTRRIPPYHVVVLNDEDHTFEYVIEMLIKLFAHSIPRAKDLTCENRLSGAGDRLHDTQGESRAETRTGPRLWCRSPLEPVQRAASLLHRARRLGLSEGFPPLFTGRGPPSRRAARREPPFRDSPRRGSPGAGSEPPACPASLSASVS